MRNLIVERSPFFFFFSLYRFHVFRIEQILFFRRDKKENKGRITFRWNEFQIGGSGLRWSSYPVLGAGHVKMGKGRPFTRHYINATSFDTRQQFGTTARRVPRREIFKTGRAPRLPSCFNSKQFPTAIQRRKREREMNRMEC